MDGLELKIDGSTLAAHVDRGEENLFSGEMIDGLVAAVHEAEADPEIRFLRISAGGDAFCLGRDRGGRTPDELRAEAGRIVKVNEALRATRLIVLTEVEGNAAGFGVGMIAASDIAIAAENARFWFPEMEAGLAPTVVLSWLSFLVSPKRAFELVTTARRFGGAEAVEMGILSETVPGGAVRGRADEWIAELEARHPEGLADVKSFLVRCRQMDPPAAARASVDSLVLSALRIVS